VLRHIAVLTDSKFAEESRDKFEIEFDPEYAAEWGHPGTPYYIYDEDTPLDSYRTMAEAEHFCAALNRGQRRESWCEFCCEDASDTVFDTTTFETWYACRECYTRWNPGCAPLADCSAGWTPEEPAGYRITWSTHHHHDWDYPSLFKGRAGDMNISTCGVCGVNLDEPSAG
jgi:hypothetical protein